MSRLMHVTRGEPREDHVTVGDLVMPPAATGALRIRDGDTLLAWLSYCEYVDEWAINDVFVVPKKRGQGFARWMLEVLLAYADEAGVRVRLYVASSGAAGVLDDAQLRAWYERSGFVVDLDVDDKVTMVREAR